MMTMFYLGSLTNWHGGTETESFLLYCMLPCNYCLDHDQVLICMTVLKSHKQGMTHVHCILHVATDGTGMGNVLGASINSRSFNYITSFFEVLCFQMMSSGFSEISKCCQDRWDIECICCVLGPPTDG